MSCALWIDYRYLICRALEYPPPEPRASPCPHACPTSHVRDATVLGSMDDARGAGSLSYPYPIGLED